MKKNPYLEAAGAIPPGETRTFRELAALAGRPAAARAAGRAIAGTATAERCAWHRVVSADGSLADDPERARLQLERLRREGARPRANESIVRYVARRSAKWIANWRTRRFAAADDPRIAGWPPERVEILPSAERALERGFRPLDEADEGSSRTRGSKEQRAAGAANEKQPEKMRSRGSRTAKKGASASRASAVGGSRASAGGGTQPDVVREHATLRGLLRGEPPATDVEERLAEIDWAQARSELGERGSFMIERALDERRCRALRDLFATPELFERTIEMAPRGYGVGTYRYFKEPLPEPAFTLRQTLYSRLVGLARSARSAPAYPPTLAEFFEQCRAAGQRRSSSILLAYERGGVNHPHRDIYGPLWFPYQAVLVLSARETEFEGAELLLCTRESDGESDLRALPLDQGDLCIFASRGFESRAPRIPSPSAGSRARYRTDAKPRWIEQTHGLSPVTRGKRFALGIVMHLAQ